MLNKDYILGFAKEILSIPSPSGFCGKVIERIKKEAENYDLSFEKTQKGNGVITIKGQDDYVIGLSAHVDTLGAMVRSISTTTLKFTSIGGPVWPTMDGEYCKVHTRDGREYTGTILSTSPAVHVYKDSGTKERKPETMEVRLDEVVKSKEDIEKLGIEVGNFISIDPKTTVTKSGFIKSRFLDDKINVASLFGYIDYLHRNKITPQHTIKIVISTYEEVGHGSSWIPEDISEYIAVDMGCIGSDLSCTEYDVSICAKDSSGPYDYEMTSKLVKLAKESNLQHAVDIYPFYGSDVSAALRGGNNIKGALIGPGVHASHGMERTHYQAIENTVKLLIEYTK
ncbi:M42 family metallopeptidase [Mycoplasmatota bacterium zrk1]